MLRIGFPLIGLCAGVLIGCLQEPGSISDKAIASAIAGATLAAFGVFMAAYMRRLVPLLDDTWPGLLGGLAGSSASRLPTSSLAASAKFKAFAIGFAIAMPIMYVICDLFSLPLFTFHPVTNRFGWGSEAGRSGEGPAIYWYGWTAMCLVVCIVAGIVAAELPEKVTNKIPLWLLWLLPTLAFIPLAWALMPYWTKG